MVADQGFTRTGYTFEGYNTKADGTGTDYAVGDSYTENSELKLYAKWLMSGSVTDVKANPSKYYGAYVNYTPKNGCSVKWRVFYADDARIYLIAEDYVPNSYLTATGLTKSTASRDNLKDYCVYSDVSRQDLVTRLTTSSYYTDFKDNAGKASSVVGAPTLEQFKTSYNAVNTEIAKQMDILYCTAGQSVAGLPSTGEGSQAGVANVDGYVLRFENTGNYAYYIKVPNDANKRDLYIRTDRTNADGMWLASFSACITDCVMITDYDGSVRYINDYYNWLGARPLVTLNSGVKLVDPDGDGVYDLQ